MAFTNDRDVCETCRKIDFQDLIQNPQPHFSTGEPSPYIMRYSNDCKLCRLIFQHQSSHRMEMTFELRSFRFVGRYPWTQTADRDARDNVLLGISVRHLRHPCRVFCGPWEDVFCARASDDSQGLYCAQPVQDIWDCAKARLWLDTCARCHGTSCKRETIRVTGMNLIDCEDMVIVQATPEMRWLALSYVWGTNFQTQDHSGYRAGSGISLEIPATISDAIRVTLQLGYRYLWVDEYCIDQNDDTHRNDQIKKMDQIYRGADLTIVAAAGDNKSYGLPGVGSTKRKDREVIYMDDIVVFSNGPDPQRETLASTWFSRAWTFQEGASSKRLLVFTGHQMSFYCQANFWMEGFGNPDPDASRLPDEIQAITHLFGLVHVTSPTCDRDSFQHILEMYSKRQTTRDADVLDAFAGVLNLIRRSHPTTHLLRGLPFYTTAEVIAHGKLTDSFEDLVASAISWTLSFYHAPRRRRSAFPSWTWAGWSEGADIGWFRDPRIPWRWLSYLQHVQLESSNGCLVMSSGLDKNDIQQELDIVTLIQFEAATIPAASFLAVADRIPTDVNRSWAPGHVLTYDRLIENERRGTWSCFVLCAQQCSPRNSAEEIFVLVVCWKADQVTAERIGAFAVNTIHIDGAGLELLQGSQTRRRVRLI